MKAPLRNKDKPRIYKKKRVELDVAGGGCQHSMILILISLSKAVRHMLQEDLDETSAPAQKGELEESQE